MERCSKSKRAEATIHNTKCWGMSACGYREDTVYGDWRWHTCAGMKR